MQNVATGQRRHPRQPYKETVEITMPAHNQNGNIIAITANISDGGICFYTFKPLEKDEEILFKTTLPVPYQRATVKWVRQCNQNIYKAGAQFFSRILHKG